MKVGDQLQEQDNNMSQNQSFLEEVLQETLIACSEKT
jgi:hypothetical protein